MASKKYIANITRVNVVTGENPRTGIDRTTTYVKGQSFELANAEMAEKLLAKKYIRPDDGTSQEAADAEAEKVEQEQQLTEKQALVKRAEELGLETKGTINDLKARIAEEEEKRADVDPTGEKGPDPDKA